MIEDVRVYRWLFSPVIPFPIEKAEEFVAREQKVSAAVLRELELEGEGGVGGCPVSIIREKKEDGTELYLGKCAFLRYRFDDELDPGKRKELKDANEGLPSGDPNIIWELAGKSLLAVLGLYRETDDDVIVLIYQRHPGRDASWTGNHDGRDEDVDQGVVCPEDGDEAFAGGRVRGERGE